MAKNSPAERMANYEAETVGGNRLDGRWPVVVLATSEVVTATAVMAGVSYRRAALRIALFRVRRWERIPDWLVHLWHGSR
jgi:hypothetical protein